MQKFETNRLQKPMQYLVDVSVFTNLAKQTPDEEHLIWEEVDGHAKQLVPCRH